MSSTSVLTRAPFRMALVAFLASVVVLITVGAVLHARLSSTLYAELEAQVIEDVALLGDIFEDGGQRALVGAIAGTTHVAVVDPESVALFGADGGRLAGTLDVAPDFVGWASRTVPQPTNGVPGHYWLRAEQWVDTTLVVGRDTHMISAALNALVRCLALAGALIGAATFAFGYWTGRRTCDRLTRMAAVFERIGQGDSTARMPVGEGASQIEQISRQMNGHLEALDSLTRDTRHTIEHLAHDLRTPLNRASLRLQEAAAAVDGRGLALVEAAGVEIDALTDVSDTILRIGRLRTAHEPSTFTAFALGQLVTEMGELYEPSVEAAGQRLVVEVTSDEPERVLADRCMIAQLIANLIENAIRYCPVGTRVVIGTRDGPAGTIVLFVEDDGPGVPAEARGAVLLPGVRLDSGRQVTGSGLGLALVAAVSRFHDAQLMLEDNKPGLSVEMTIERVS